MPLKFSKELIHHSVFGVPLRRQHRTSPCEAACPAGNRIQAMKSLLEEGRNNEARAVLFSRNPFAGVTGRVCPHPCEAKCNRSNYDEGLRIRALERFASEAGDSPAFRPLPATGKKVAVVGSGPAGTTCAFFYGCLAMT